MSSDDSQQVRSLRDGQQVPSLRVGYVDLHCHYIPAIDDGVRTVEQGIALCEALGALGYTTVAATPHIRPGMFDNQRADLEARFARFVEAAAGRDLPELVLGAEHFCDGDFRELFESRQALPYTGGKALLIELSTERVPPGVAEQCFRMQVQGVRPVIAHPERYSQLFDATTALERLLDMGVPWLLDLMSLEGKYGRRPRRAAERMLEEGAYYAACTDCHRPEDAEIVARAIERLRQLVGGDEAHVLIADHPRAILRGEVDP
ncbi:MAG TPA: CpsB/CapC family capsule biosynthesis tyrosine phosphatase [Polyangiales bacterium]|nr:CpsB/CapC family capsule biosynthesis tyrosine phosphatase [Polyangiales bacterium]